MGDFLITGPDGKRYKVTGDSAEGAVAALKKMLGGQTGQPDAPKENVIATTDDGGRVIGMLTETDFLRRLKADTFLELLLRMIEDSCEISHRCHETPGRAAITAPAVTVRRLAGFRQIIAAFRRHAGRSMPVVDDDGRLAGMLLRKDFLEALDRGAHR